MAVTVAYESLRTAAEKYSGREVMATVLDGKTGEKKGVFITPASGGSLGFTGDPKRLK